MNDSLLQPSVLLDGPRKVRVWRRLGARTDLRGIIRDGDLVVAGHEVGRRPARPTPRELRVAGVGAVCAPGFDPRFARDALEQGLPLIACDLSRIPDGTRVTVDLPGRRVIWGEVILALPEPRPLALAVWLAGGIASTSGREAPPPP